MNNSELRGSLTKWIGEFEVLVGQIPNKDKLVPYLASRIEDTVFVESDPDVIEIMHNGKKQPARILSEQKSRGIVQLQLLHDHSFMTLAYDGLKKIAKGSDIVRALDAVNGTNHSQMF
jgi:hypothetical protein